MSVLMPTTQKIVAECCFVDVSQGSANVILLGDRRAIVIDCGPRSAGRVLVRILDYFGVESIAALVVTHNDADHCEGAELLLSQYAHAIGTVYFLDDRPSSRNWFLPRVRQELERGKLAKNQVRRLEADTDVYRDEAKALALQVLFPQMLDNIDGRESGRPNATSGVLKLRCQSRSVVFSGDLGYAELRTLSEDGAAPIECDVLAVPHHGARLTRRGDSQAHRRVYEQYLRCKTAVVSVGSSNQHHHPSQHHITALRAAGAQVLCTQVTEGCCDDLERLRRGVYRSSLPGASVTTKRLTTAGRSKLVACAGTILVEIGPDVVHVQGLEEHQRRVDQLVDTAGAHPLCRGPV
jgi:competence protein ComEC